MTNAAASAQFLLQQCDPSVPRPAAIGSPQMTMPENKSMHMTQTFTTSSQCFLCVSVTVLQSYINSRTLFPGLGDDISSWFAHHLCDVERAVGLFSNGDGSIHSLSLHLEKNSRSDADVHQCQIRFRFKPTQSLKTNLLRVAQDVSLWASDSQIQKLLLFLRLQTNQECI